MIDVAGGEKVPRKGGRPSPAPIFLIVSKTDLAPYVGANLDVMEADTKRVRDESPLRLCRHAPAD